MSVHLCVFVFFILQLHLCECYAMHILKITMDNLFLTCQQPSHTLISSIKVLVYKTKHSVRKTDHVVQSIRIAAVLLFPAHEQASSSTHLTTFRSLGIARVGAA